MIISLLAFLAVFTVIVLVHEFGHFIAARRSGVKVYEFSIGFPFSPRLCTLFHYKETHFTLRLLPLGGFVSFSKDGDEDARALFRASRVNRVLIMSAGSFFNVVFAFLVFLAVFMFGKHLHFIDAVYASAETLWAILSGTVVFLVKVLSGHGGAEGLSGPVGIAVMAGKAAGKGLLNLFYFTGVLSMSLGIMNLFPLPALDGGQLLMLLIEAVRRKPLRIRTYQAVNLTGFVLFIILSLLVTYHDIVRLMA
ncbi:MAG: Regulator of sigma-W protease RasP [Syntrophorhabdus sp. PtaU1.Bin058]|nr:MAG: Regulator of sigma-W protease RasP [Syntrophorhabdus sp. PtaU1.Bin058]